MRALKKRMNVSWVFRCIDNGLAWNFFNHEKYKRTTTITIRVNERENFAKLRFHRSEIQKKKKFVWKKYKKKGGEKEGNSLQLRDSKKKNVDARVNNKQAKVETIFGKKETEKSHSVISSMCMNIFTLLHIANSSLPSHSFLGLLF
jgi:hypothetical protein